MPKKKAQQEPWQARLGTTGLNPIMAMDMQDAIKARKKQATLDGRKFTIKYKEDGETVYYRPVDGFAPAGYLNIKRFLNEY